MTVTEGNTGTGNATFTVSLSVAYDVAVTVHYQTANGSATAGSDYAAASGDVSIAAGQTTKTFTVAVIGDRSAEPTETRQSLHAAVLDLFARLGREVPWLPRQPAWKHKDKHMNDP